MKTIIDYLDDLKEKNGSDYRTAKLLKIGIPSLSMIRSRERMSDETAIKVADLLGVNQSEVLVAAAIARSTGEVKKAWEKISKISGIAAGFLMAIQTVNALPLSLTAGICILCKIVERRKTKPDYLDYIGFLTAERQDHEFIPRRRTQQLSRLATLGGLFTGGLPKNLQGT